MSRCNYNSKRIIPAPNVSFDKNYNTTPNGEKISSNWSITITGKVLAYMGSPIAQSGVNGQDGTMYDQSGYPADEYFPDESRLGAVFRKQQELRKLFSEDGHMLEFQGDDGLTTVRANIRILRLSFPQQNPIQWFNDFDYTVECEADLLYLNGSLLGEDEFTDYIVSASENWSIETLEEAEGINMPRTYRLSHSVNAQGRIHYNDDSSSISAVQSAKNYVIPKLGLNTSYINSSGVKDLPDYYQGFNHIRSEDTNVTDGSYSITETWLLASGSALEEFNISTTRTSQNGLTNVSINGSITGLELRDANMNVISYKYDNANTKYNQVSGLIFSRAQTYGGVSLNTVPLSVTLGKNPMVGTISYAYEYDNRPTNSFTDALSEQIEIIDDFGGSIVAAISVPFRPYGPILQDVGTKRESTRTLSVEVVLGPQVGFSVPNSFYTDLNNLIDNVAPQGVYQSFLVDNTQAYNPKEGRVSVTKSWLYEA